MPDVPQERLARVERASNISLVVGSFPAAFEGGSPQAVELTLTLALALALALTLALTLTLALPLAPAPALPLTRSCSSEAGTASHLSTLCTSSTPQSSSKG